MDRERRWRDENDWDWYYYEYRYVPYSDQEDFGNRERMGRDYGRNYGRNYSQGYGRDFNRDYERENRSFDYGDTSRWNQGRYSGVGPRGYRRSDDRIKEDVNDRLTWHGDLDATDIQVEVNDGIVTLSGVVNSRYEKRMAESIAESVSGVWDVTNNLRFNRESGWNREFDWNREEGGMGTEMSSNLKGQIRNDMDVVGRDGEHVGRVKEIRSNDFLVDRSMARDVYIPFSACQMSGGQIRLNIRADEVDNQDWPAPELFETMETSKKKR